MNTFKRYLKKFSIVFCGFVLAMLTTIVFVCLFFRGSVCNPNCHKKLFLKHNVCLHTYNYINSTIDSMSSNIFADSTDSSFEHNLIKTIKSSISLKFVSINLDTIRDDMFQYFNGQKEFLPDISFSNIDNSDEIEKLAQNITPSNFKTLTKVNLSTIFATFNLNHIIRALFIIKFIFFVIKCIPVYFSILILCILLVILIFTKKSKSYYTLLRWYASFVCVLNISFGLVLIFSYRYIFYTHSFILNINKNLLPLISNYTYDLILPICLMLFATAVLAFFVVMLSKKLLIKLRTFNDIPHLSKFERSHNSLFYSFVLLIVIICIRYKLGLIKDSIKWNNFDSLIFTKDVVVAKDNSIYAIKVVVLDSKTKMPIPNIAVSMTGIAKDGTYFNNMSKTNSDGSITFDASNGHFHIDFVSDLFPPEYILPKRSHINFDTAKTIVLPFNLKYMSKTASKDNLGSVSISMLDSDNNPYPNIQLCFTPKFDTSQKLYTVANSNGVAVFKGKAGTYTVSTSRLKFPTNQYHLPNNFDIALEDGAKLSYTIKLVENTN